MNNNPWKLLDQYPGPVVRALAAIMRDRGVACYIAGGTVRDWLMGRESGDLDVTVPASNRLSPGRSWARWFESPPVPIAMAPARLSKNPA